MARFFAASIARHGLLSLALAAPCAIACGSDNSNGQTPGVGGGAGTAAFGGSSAAAGQPVTPGNPAGSPGAGGAAGTPGGAPSAGGAPIGGAGAPGGGAPGGGTQGGAGTPAGSGGTAGIAGAAGGGGMAGSGGGPIGNGKPYVDPGTMPWQAVPMADVASVCKLDPDKLTAAGTTLNVPWAIVRYGKLCWQHNADNFAPAEAYSTTKTLGATVAGIVSYQTKAIPRAGKKTGQFLDTDMALDWLDSVTYNKAAKVAHVMGMVAHDTDLSWGKKTFAYDTIGTTEINTISDMMNAAIAQDKTRMGANVEEFTKKFLYTPLGMTKSTWTSGSANKVLAYTWTTDVYDMLRVGLLLMNYGEWSGQRILDADWIYRMTHPSFEDANTGFGYLTWLNSSSNWCSIDAVKKQGAGVPGPCAPVAIHKTYPHGASEAMDCNYTAPYTCQQTYDVGVFNAEGVGGQLIQAHRGLDMVIVARNAQPGGTGPGTAKTVWDAIRPAVIAADPMFKGDETSFCKAYGANNYAPDMH
jgi:hypothetical protein